MNETLNQKPEVQNSSTTLLLVRHGQSEGNAARRFGGHTATPLSTLGREQARLTAHALASESITAIYSSDLQRAVQTAAPLAELTGLAIHRTQHFGNAVSV